MSIEFHCEKCGRLVKAPDDAGGRHGKCPTCHQSIYIPEPDAEPLDLAPIDEEAERRERQARAEASALASRLASDREPPSGPDDGPSLRGQIAEPRMPMDQLVIEYAKAMAAGDLNTAEQYAQDIRRDKSKAQEAIQALMSDDLMPEPLASLPRPVLVGFFKQI